MPDTSVKHIRRDLSPCLLLLPGELFDAGNCLQVFGTLLQNRPDVFNGIGLCAVPRSNISHLEEEQVIATPVLRLFGRAQKVPSGMTMALLASATIARVVTSRHGHSHDSHVWWVILCLRRRLAR